MAILDQLDEGIDRVSSFIGRALTSRGQFVGGCKSRALETGLFLHLLRSLGLHEERMAGLARYCRQYLDCAPAEASSLDEVITGSICRRVLGDPPLEGELSLLVSMLNTFKHSTQERKLAFFAVLFADLGVLPPPVLKFPRTSRSELNQQLWVSIIMTSLRVLHAVSQGGRQAVDPDDVAYLIREQAADGGWEQHVLATIVVLLALLRAGRGEAALARGVAYVVAQIREDGGIPFIANEDTWVTCLSAHILAEARPSTCDLNAVARYLVSEQHKNGGWAYSEGVRQTDADDTSISLAFLSRHDPVAHRESIRRAQWYLLALQNDDGGFPTFVRGAASEAEITAKALLALRSSSEMCFGRRMDRGWQWLANSQRDDGSFSAEWKLCATYPALHVLTAAQAAAPSPVVSRVQGGTASLLRRWRQPGGGWGLKPDDRQVHLLSTAYALAGLATDIDNISRIEFTSSVKLLLEMQSRDGGFYSSGDSLGPRPFVYDVPLLA
ncbi:MAG TPA: hypothetical protein ENK31_05890, partial [Nannocystis exedens]|nr:hypothetical protein [Nannocystis exedens]